MGNLLNGSLDVNIRIDQQSLITLCIAIIITAIVIMIAGTALHKTKNG